MAIAFDAVSNSTYQTAQSTYSWNHTCTGSNLFLSVDVEILSVPGTFVTALSYNGVPLVQIGSRATVSGAGRVECWGLIAPASGTHSVSLTLSASVSSAGTVTSYTGVHQTDAWEQFNSNQATNVGVGNDATVVITTISDNCWIHAACATDDASINANQTSRNNVTGALGSGANEDNNAVVHPAGSTTMGYTNLGITATWVIAGYGIRPAGDAAFAPDDDEGIVYSFVRRW